MQVKLRSPVADIFLVNPAAAANDHATVLHLMPSEPRARCAARRGLRAIILLAAFGWLGSVHAQAVDRLVISTQGNATLGGVSFQNEDLVEYDPGADTGTWIFDGDAVFANEEDVNGVHMLSSTRIALTTTGSARIGALWFQDEDVVVYDTVAGTATLLLDGGSVFSNDEEIDALHILPNGHIVLSTTGSAQIGGLNFANEDLVDYDPVTGTATLLFDGSTVFAGNENVDAVSILSNGHIVLSTTVDAQIGGLTFENEDLVEYDPVAGTATLLFDGSLAFSGNEHVDAVHAIEVTGPHFAITHDGAGDICGPEPVTITRHDAAHAVDGSYLGTITVTTSTGNGDWSLINGGGALISAGNGQGTYTYVAGDGGQVVLGLADPLVETVSVNVTDGTDTEDPGEDPNLAFTAAATDTFRDELTTVSYARDDGTLTWTGGWIERDDDGSPAGGNVFVNAGELVLEDFGNTNGEPSAEREADLSAFASATFSFAFRTTLGVDTNDAVFAEVSDDGGASWTVLERITGIAGAVSATRSYDISAFATPSTRVRFRVDGLNGAGGGGCCYGAANEEFRVTEVQIEGPSASACGPSAFRVVHDGFGIHCLAEQIQLSALDAVGATLTSYAGTVTVSTQNGAGTWSVSGGFGVLSDPVPNDGLATYTFDGDPADGDPADDGTVTLLLDYPEGSSPINVLATDGTSSDDDSEGLLAYSPNGFTVSPVVLGNPPGAIPPIADQVAGTDFALYLTAYGQTPGDPVCGVIESYDGPRTVELWSVYDNPASGTRAVTLGGTPIGTSEAGAVGFNVAFVQGQATVPFTAKYKDVGRIRIDVKDDSVADPNLPTGIRGTTNLFVVKPADLVLSAIQRTSDGFGNPGTPGPVGLVFVRAGEDFSVTVTALDAEGSPTPNYGRETPAEGVLLSVALAPGCTGCTASPPLQNAAAFGPFAGGVATGTTFQWHEVGVIGLTPSVADLDYLNAGNVVGTASGDVGRFTPFDFDVTAVGGAPAFLPGCGTFTYMDQGFDYATAPQVTITARSQSTATTVNYDGAWWKLADFAETVSHDGALPGGVTLDTGLAGHTPIDCSGGGCAGVVTVSFNGPLAYLRGGGPVAPFDALVDISFPVVDADGVSYAGTPFRFEDISFPAGSEQQRYGRMAVVNAHGSELLGLPVPVRAQYFDGSAFVTNLQDGCTVVGVGNLSLSNDQETGQTDGDIAIGAGASTATLANSPVVGGEAGVTMSGPGAGNTGYSDILVDLSVATGADLPWLQFDWDGDSNPDNPAGRASFGVYGNSPHVIYVREPW